MKEARQLKKTVEILRELGEDWRKNMAIVNEAVRGGGEVLEAVKRLCRKSSQGSMVRIGLALVAFPLPIVIDDVLGWSLITVGLIQRKIKNSSLYLEDVYDTFPHVIRELEETRQEIV